MATAVALAFATLPAVANANPIDSTPTEPQAQCLFPDGSTKQVIVTQTNGDAYIPGSYRVYGTGPAQLQAQVGQVTTMTATFSSSVTAEAGIIIANASTQFGVSLARSSSATLMSTYTISIPAGQTMYIEAGGHGIATLVRVETFDSWCNIITRNGTAAIPRSSNWVWYRHFYV